MPCTAKHWSGGKSPFTYMGMPAVLEYSEKPQDWKTLWQVYLAGIRLSLRGRVVKYTGCVHMAPFLSLL